MAKRGREVFHRNQKKRPDLCKSPPYDDKNGDKIFQKVIAALS